MGLEGRIHIVNSISGLKSKLGVPKKLNSNEKISVQNLCLGFPNSKWLQKVKENKVWIRDWKVWIQTVNSNGDSYVNNLEGGIVG